MFKIRKIQNSKIKCIKIYDKSKQFNKFSQTCFPTASNNHLRQLIALVIETYIKTPNKHAITAGAFILIPRMHVHQNLPINPPRFPHTLHKITRALINHTRAIWKFSAFSTNANRKQPKQKYILLKHIFFCRFQSGGDVVGENAIPSICKSSGDMHRALQVAHTLYLHFARR